MLQWHAPQGVQSCTHPDAYICERILMHTFVQASRGMCSCIHLEAYARARSCPIKKQTFIGHMKIFMVRDLIISEASIILNLPVG